MLPVPSCYSVAICNREQVKVGLEMPPGKTVYNENWDARQMLGLGARGMNLFVRSQVRFQEEKNPVGGRKC